MNKMLAFTLTWGMTTIAILTAIGITSNANCLWAFFIPALSPIVIALTEID